MDVLNWSLNCIWRWGSTSEDLGGEEYPFIAFATDLLWLEVVVPIAVSSIGEIEQF